MSEKLQPEQKGRSVLAQALNSVAPEHQVSFFNHVDSVLEGEQKKLYESIASTLTRRSTRGQRMVEDVYLNLGLRELLNDVGITPHLHGAILNSMTNKDDISVITDSPQKSANH